MKPTFSIMVAALALAAGCSVLLLGSTFLLKGVVDGYRSTGQLAIRTGDLFFIVLPAGFSLLGLVTSFGLMRLREWARKVTILLSVVPVLACALLVIWRPPSVFPPPKPDEQYAILTIGSGLGLWIYEALLLILIPVSIWWLVVMTRESVRSQFR
jgi:hypothetical protein